MRDAKLKFYVIMPSGNRGEFHHGYTESNYIYKYIKEGLESEPIEGHSILVKRETEEDYAGKISDQIINNLISDYICIADLTGQNANVIIELGMRYCFRSGLTILITQDVSSLPSDIASHKAIKYSIFELDELVIKFRASIQRGLRRKSISRTVSTSIVYDFLPNAQFMRDSSSATRDPMLGIMPWHEYWNKITLLARQLNDLAELNKYLPRALIGLDKGGMTIAEFLLFLLEGKYRRTELYPLIEENKSFDNMTNRSVLESLQSKVSNGSERLEILLVDDHVATGRCARAAKHLVEASIPYSDVRFLPLVCRSKKTLSALFDEEILIWTHEAIRRSRVDVESMHYVSWTSFPTSKPIKRR